MLCSLYVDTHNESSEGVFTVRVLWFDEIDQASFITKNFKDKRFSDTHVPGQTEFYLRMKPSITMH